MFFPKNNQVLVNKKDHTFKLLIFARKHSFIYNEKKTNG